MPSSGYVFYNIFSQLGGTAHAIAIVEEQLRAIRNSSFWPVDEIRFATIGDPELRGKVERVCRESTVYDPVEVKDFLKEVASSSIGRSFGSGRIMLSPPCRSGTPHRL